MIGAPFIQRCSELRPDFIKATIEHFPPPPRSHVLDVTEPERGEDETIYHLSHSEEEWKGTEAASAHFLR